MSRYKTQLDHIFFHLEPRCECYTALLNSIKRGFSKDREKGIEQVCCRQLAGDNASPESLHLKADGWWRGMEVSVAAVLHFYLCHKKTHFFFTRTPFVGLRNGEHTPRFTRALLVILRGVFVRYRLHPSLLYLDIGEKYWNVICQGILRHCGCSFLLVRVMGVRILPS